jgi:hypothetical protein
VDKVGSAQGISRLQIGINPQTDFVRADTSELASSLNIEFTTPEAGRYSGVLGLINGIQSDDWSLPSGVLATSQSQFMEAWRTTPENSLFTYQAPESHATYNLVQSELRPTVQQLLDGGFVARAKALLGVCQADLVAVGDVYIQTLALELAVGRSEKNLLAGGLCFEGRVANITPPAPFIRVDVSGTVSLSNLPDARVAGATVLVSSPQIGRVCEVATNEAGMYSCNVSVVPPNTAQIQLNYRVFGRGVVQERSVMVDTPINFAGAGVNQDFTTSVQRVLRLKGVVSGVGAAKATVSVSGMAAGSVFAGADGAYELLVPLPDGVNAGRLTYEVVAEDRKAQSAFNVNVDSLALGVSDLTRDITLVSLAEPVSPVRSLAPSPGKIIFSGLVLNDLVANTALPGAKVSIRAVGAITGDVCETFTQVGGGYLCYADVKATQPFKVLVSVSGFGAFTPIEVDVPVIPVAGSDLRLELPSLKLRPTTLKLEGLVRGGGRDLPKADLRIVARTASWSREFIGLSREDGRYLAYIAVPESVVAPIILDYSAKALGVEAKETRQVDSLNPGVLNPRVQDLIVEQRTVVFSGKVSNQLVPDAPVAFAKVTIKRVTPTIIPICTTMTNAQGLYACEYPILTLEPFTVEYSVSDRGSALLKDVIVSPADGNSIRPLVAKDFVVSPTTLKVSGKATDAQGLALPNVIVAAEIGSEVFSGTANARGEYSIAIPLASNVSAGTVKLSTTYRAPPPLTLEATGISTSNFSVPTSGTLVDLAQNVALTVNLDSDKVYLSGLIRSNSNVDVGGLTLVIRGYGNSEDVGVLCTATVSTISHYQCSGQQISRRSRLDLEYRVLRGSELISAVVQQNFDIVPGNPQGNSLEKNVLLEPTIVQFAGVVTDQTGRSLKNAKVSLTTLSTEEVYTNDEGKYFLNVVLPLGTTNGTATARVRFDQIQGLLANVQLEEQSFTVPVGTVTQLPVITTKMPLTTLKVSGVVKQANGQVVSQARVELKFSITPTNASVTSVETDVDGKYVAFLLLSSAQTTLNLSLKATDSVNTVNKTVTLPVIAIGPNETVQDITLVNTEIGTVRWSVQLTQYGTSRPVLGSNGVVYLIANSKLVAFNELGQKVWEIVPPAGQFDNKSPMIAFDQSVYVVGYQANQQLLFGFSQSGQWLRTITLGGAYYSHFAIAPSGVIYAVSTASGGGSKLEAFNTSGQVVWTVQSGQVTNRAFAPTRPMVAPDGTVYVALHDGLYAINPDGSTRWHDKFSNTYGDLVLFGIGSDSRLFFTHPNTGLLAARASNGDDLWASQGIGNVATIGNDGSIFLAYRNATNEVSKYDSNGQFVKKYPLDGTLESMLVTADGSLLVQGNGFIRAILPDGTLSSWAYSGFGAATSTLSPNGVIYTTLATGKLIALNASDVGITDSTWAIGDSGNNQNNGALPAVSVSQRMIHFSGVVGNANQSQTGLPNYQVRIEDSNGKTLCSAFTNATGIYSCGAPTTDLGLIQANVKASGSFGDEIAAVSVAAGNVNSVQQVVQNISVAVTTLRISGIVTNDLGQPIANAAIAISGSVTANLSSSASGTYLFETSFKKGQTSVTWNIRVSNGGLSSSSDTTLVLTEGTLNEKSTNFKLDASTPGTARWTLNRAGQVIATALSNDGVLYALVNENAGGKLFALNSDSSERWSVSLNAPASGLSVAQTGVIYVGTGTSNNGSLRAFNADGSSRWNFTTPNLASAPAIAADGSLLFTTGYRLIALSSAGTERWAIDAYNAVQTPTIGADGTIYLT